LNQVLTTNDPGENLKKLKDLENVKQKLFNKKPSLNPNPQENIWYKRVHEALKSDFKKLKDLPGEFFIKKECYTQAYSHISISQHT